MRYTIISVKSFIFNAHHPIVLSLSIPHTPRSTLFPYTTLFRSLAYELNGAPLPVANGAPVRLRAERQLGYKQAKYLQDRKSTRLNSSHLGISYAVFCLKKKILKLSSSQ